MAAAAALPSATTLLRTVRNLNHSDETIRPNVTRCAATSDSWVGLVEGSVIALDQDAGAELDVLVNGTLVAHGEIVVVDDRYGVRLTDVVSPVERVEQLN